ncbi:MAG: 4-hydroxybenzoyl-CoA thioesterase [marine bacterium B5-7]|nr:MAG: 4-hydroxybenzoyl-CoA thioesterase [marine bacterium B5-7]
MAERIFTHDIPIRFHHVDAAGIVFYPRYFEMMNLTIEEWFAQALGCSYNELHFKRRLGIPTAHIDIGFTAPSRLEETIRFNLSLLELRNSAFVLEHRVTHGSEQRLRAVHRLVCASLDELKPVPIPLDIRERMLDYLQTQSNIETA